MPYTRQLKALNKDSTKEQMREVVHLVSQQVSALLSALRPAELDLRWFSVATIDLQKGFAALQRAIDNDGKF